MRLIRRLISMGRNRPPTGYKRQPYLPASISSECVDGVWRAREFEIPPGEPIPGGFHLAKTETQPDGSMRRWVSYHGDPARAPE